MVAAAAALFHAPETPDTGDLRTDLLACGRAYVQQEGRNAQVLASVMNASRHDPELRQAAQEALGSPYGGLFDAVLARAGEHGVVSQDLDLATIAHILPAVAYEQVATHGRLFTDDDVLRVVDAVLLPALGLTAPPRPARTA